MQIVIDIPEKTYNLIKEDSRFINDKRSEEKDVYLAIKNSIVFQNTRNETVTEMLDKYQKIVQLYLDWNNNYELTTSDAFVNLIEILER